MAVWSNIKLSQIQEFNRTDAEFYKPDYLVSFQHLLSVGGEKISTHAYVTDGIHASPQIVENGIRYISAKCVKDNEFVIDNCINISPVQNEQNPRTQLSIGDVIITTVGTIGNVAVVEEDLTPCNCDRHVGIIRIKNPENLSPFYLSTFLNSRYGKFQSLRESAGNVQLNLYIRNIGHLVIPRLGNEESKIANLTKQAYQLRSLSKKLYSKAQQLLESELGLNKLSFQKPVGYTARFSELETSRRADAEFYHLKYEPFLDVARNYRNGYSTVSQLTKRTIPNFDASMHEADFDYIEIGDISTTDGAYRKNQIDAARLPANAKIKLSGGEILISQVRPTRGAIAIVQDHLTHESICSGAFYVCTANDPEYREIIWLYLRSIRNIFEKYCGGTSYPTIDSRYISKFPVPLFDQTLAQEIKELIRKSKSAKQESEQLLDQAKTRVEQLIEEAVQS